MRRVHHRAEAIAAPRGSSPARRIAPTRRSRPGQCPATHRPEAAGATYKKAVASRSGSSFREVATVLSGLSLADLIASLQEDEVVVCVKYAGVNGGCETFRCRGEYWFAGNASLTDFPLGAEGVGTVIATGSNDDTDPMLDAPVMFVGGAFSEYVKVKRTSCVRVPAALPEYAALRISGHVAYAALKYTAGIRPENVVFVTAGAGATGSFAVQVAKQAGCHVVATCRNKAKAETLRRLGVDRVIDYSLEDVAQVLEREYKHSVDVCYEGVGGRLLELAWNVALKPDGKLLSVGYISQYPHNSEDTVEDEKRRHAGLNLPPPDELFWKGMTLPADTAGKTFYGNVWPEDAIIRQEALREAMELVQEGIVEGVVDPRRFRGVEEAADAVEYMLRGEAIGKVLVEMP